MLAACGAWKVVVLWRTNVDRGGGAAGGGACRQCWQAGAAGRQARRQRAHAPPSSACAPSAVGLCCVSLCACGPPRRRCARQARCLCLHGCPVGWPFLCANFRGQKNLGGVSGRTCSLILGWPWAGLMTGTGLDSSSSSNGSALPPVLLPPAHPSVHAVTRQLRKAQHSCFNCVHSCLSDAAFVEVRCGARARTRRPRAPARRLPCPRPAAHLRCRRCGTSTPTPRCLRTCGAGPGTCSPPRYGCPPRAHGRSCACCVLRAAPTDGRAAEVRPWAPCAACRARAAPRAPCPPATSRARTATTATGPSAPRASTGTWPSWPRGRAASWSWMPRATCTSPGSRCVRGALAAWPRWGVRHSRLAPARDIPHAICGPSMPAVPAQLRALRTR